MAYYYLKKMSNDYNEYKYQYLDHVEATIDIRQNYWEFDMQLFCINDYKLPPGSLVATLDIPYQEIKDISFNLSSNQDRAQAAVEHNKNYSHIYESRFNVDVSSNQFFKQDINNTKINCSIKLEIDPQVIKNAGVTLDQLALDTLIYETAAQRWDFGMYYTNTQIINKKDKVVNINGYKLDNKHECSSLISIVNVECDNYKDCLSSINNLVTISSNELFQVIQAKVKFYYWLDDESDTKTLETNLVLDRKITKNTTISLNLCTSYDFVNNKVTLDTQGILGFYIPKYSHGYYEIELLVNQLNNITKFIIKNNYVFIDNINNPHITTSKIRINSLDGFERIKWNG